MLPITAASDRGIEPTEETDRRTNVQASKRIWPALPVGEPVKGADEKEIEQITDYSQTDESVLEMLKFLSQF